MSRFLIISASMGAGHDAVASELAGRLRADGHRAARVDLLNLLPSGAGRSLRAAYRTALRRCPWAYQAVYSAFFHDRGASGGATDWSSATGPLAAVLAPRLRRVVDRWRADALVSTFHQAAQVTGRLRKAHGGDCPPSTVVVTDFAVHRQWLHPDNSLYLCLTDAAAVRVRAATGRPAEVCGPVVPASFTAAGREESDRQPSPWAAELARRGPGRPAVLVSAGAWGVGRGLTATARLLADAGHLPVLLCGNDHRLRARAAKLPGVLPLGWIEDLPGLMAASSALVDNAAGQTAVQALAAGVPVVGYRPIPGHGAEGVREMAGAGITEHVADDVALLGALDRLARPGPDRDRRIAAGRAVFTADAAKLVAR
ncbi:galactosyldiacylglycerol synthase [Streptomyces sp. JH34]|uniref:MGDG synthase family glycosyltransferase n=1 Tax=Streptomyces sp. JH34 TaxID=2793633 RepID=UPI0023F7EA5A|nr:galactosyldiacylglycerol synthase [Streptomyces sp. JH34]MDF6022970.1 galactosyldiacylglycerol synthase [Streptomyces sp. JH34]